MIVKLENGTVYSERQLQCNIALQSLDEGPYTWLLLNDLLLWLLITLWPFMRLLLRFVHCLSCSVAVLC